MSFGRVRAAVTMARPMRSVFKRTGTATRLKCMPISVRPVSYTHLPVRFVAGNCDFLADAGREECFSLGGVRLFVAHGDRYGVKYGLERLSYRAEELGARAALFLSLIHI